MAVRAADVQSKGARTRLRLLEAAERVFGERGFHAASITDITRTAEVASGTFYVYFRSKAGVLTELVRTRGHELRTELANATSGLSSRAEIERAGFATFLGWVRRHPDLYRVVRNTEYVDAAVFREWYTALADGYTKAVAQAMDDCEIARGHAEAIVYCLMGIGDFTGMRWILWEEGAEVPEEVMESVMQFVLRGLGAGDQNADRA